MIIDYPRAAISVSILESKAKALFCMLSEVFLVTRRRKQAASPGNGGVDRSRNRKAEYYCNSAFI